MHGKIVLGAQACDRRMSPNDSRVLGTSKVRVSAHGKLLLRPTRTSVPRDQQGTVTHYPVNTEKRLCIVCTLILSVIGSQW